MNAFNKCVLKIIRFILTAVVLCTTGSSQSNVSSASSVRTTGSEGVPGLAHLRLTDNNNPGHTKHHNSILPPGDFKQNGTSLTNGGDGKSRWGGR